MGEVRPTDDGSHSGERKRESDERVRRVILGQRFYLARDLMTYTPFFATKEKLEGRVYLNTREGKIRFECRNPEDEWPEIGGEEGLYGLQQTPSEREKLLEMMATAPHNVKKIITKAMRYEFQRIFAAEVVFPETAVSFGGIFREICPGIDRDSRFKEYMAFFEQADKKRQRYLLRKFAYLDRRTEAVIERSKMHSKQNKELKRKAKRAG